MFRNMRRERQILSAEECTAILEKGTSGVLAVLGDEDYPYAVPLSYVYADNRIYFHCAASGHKLDGIKKSDKVSFCVIGQDQVLPEKYTSCFQSVIVFGRIRIMEEEREKWEAIEKLALKYAPEDDPQNRKNVIERYWESMCVLELAVEHMTGKEGIELVKAR